MSEFFLRLVSSLIAIAMLPLMIAVCLEVYLLGQVILHQQAINVAIAAALLVVFAGLWFVFPLAMRRGDDVHRSKSMSMDHGRIPTTT